VLLLKREIPSACSPAAIDKRNPYTPGVNLGAWRNIPRFNWAASWGLNPERLGHKFANFGRVHDSVGKKFAWEREFAYFPPRSPAGG